MNENYYRILGLDNFASEAEIKAAYRKLAKKYHPDKNPDASEQFRRISDAYQTLMDSYKRQIHDEWLRYGNQPPGQSSHRPKYRERKSYYTTEKRFYTPKVKMYGAIFTIVFVMICTLGPIYMMYKASDYAYTEGLEYEEAGEYGRATNSYNRAITLFGQRSGDASIKAARIGLFKTQSDAQAFFYVLKGLEHASSPEEIGELHYLKGLIQKNENNLDEALESLNLARNYGYLKDSIYMQRAQIAAFFNEDFDSALAYFDSLIVRNPFYDDAIFGKAWTLQRLNKATMSIEYYNRLIDLNENHVLGRFYRGHNNIVLGDTVQACRDFQRAYDLGYQPALIYIVNQCQ